MKLDLNNFTFYFLGFQGWLIYKIPHCHPILKLELNLLHNIILSLYYIYRYIHVSNNPHLI